MFEAIGKGGQYQVFDFSQVMVPEMRETYTSLIRWERAGASMIVFGSGGESLTGNLYAVPEASLVAGTLDGLETLVEGSATRGMIAPPSIAATWIRLRSRAPSTNGRIIDQHSLTRWQSGSRAVRWWSPTKSSSMQQRCKAPA